MALFGSGNKSKTNATDARVGASDNALVLQGGSFIFNPGRKSENETTSADSGFRTPVNWQLIVSIIGVLITVLVWFNSRK